MYPSRLLFIDVVIYHHKFLFILHSMTIWQKIIKGLWYGHGWSESGKQTDLMRYFLQVFVQNLLRTNAFFMYRSIKNICIYDILNWIEGKKVDLEAILRDTSSKIKSCISHTQQLWAIVRILEYTLSSWV